MAELPPLLLGTDSNGPTEEVFGDDAQRTIRRRVLPTERDDDGRLLLKLEEEDEEEDGRMRRLALVWWRLLGGLSRGSDDMVL